MNEAWKPIKVKWLAQDHIASYRADARTQDGFFHSDTLGT